MTMSVLKIQLRYTPLTLTFESTLVSIRNEVDNHTYHKFNRFKVQINQGIKIY